MSESDATRIATLRREIHRHNRLYFVEVMPVITDEYFDGLMRELASLEQRHQHLITEDSPTRRVGGGPSKGFDTVDHAVRMFSIDNTYDRSELFTWHRRIVRSLAGSNAEEPAAPDTQPMGYLVEPKIDGVALNLRYEEGVLIRATSRGDGRRGDNVTTNVRTIRSIPLRLDETSQPPPTVLEVRGEVCMTRKELHRINRERESESLEPLANPRNATAGTLKQLDPAIVAQRRLLFIAHGMGQIEGTTFETYGTFLKAIRAWGIPTGKTTHQCGTIGDVWNTVVAFETERSELPYDTDGMVVKVDDIASQLVLGNTSKSPRWCIAYKYAAEQAQTMVRRVTWQVGKGGTVTPVAELDPVPLAGTTVRRASLHNTDEIQRKDVRIGDTVIIAKAGEIIPQVINVEIQYRPGGNRKLLPPSLCPSCNRTLTREPGEAALRCINPTCPAQQRERFIWFAGRGQMNIDGLGEKLVRQLADAGLLTSFGDIYRLADHRDRLVDLERMGDRKTTKLIEAIDQSKTRGLPRLIAALGIRHVGTRAAEIVAADFPSIDVLLTASVEQLEAIKEIGGVTANSLHAFLHSSEGRDIITDLRGAGVHMLNDAPRQHPPENGPLNGKTIVITGTFDGIDRLTLSRNLSAHGAKVTGTVSKKTDIVVAGTNPGSKLDKARSLGIEVWDAHRVAQVIA